jgi:DNA-binding response OmpR family regulator
MAPETSKRILAVDDDASTLALISRVLSDQGFTVWTAQSGREALERLRKEGLPHLAIVDLLMPGMDGTALCGSLKSFSDVPIIILTAVDTKDTLVDLLERYAEDYIVKPFDPRELAVRVTRLLRRIGDFSYAASPIFEVDDRLAIDLSSQRAIVEGKPVSLTATESKLLYLLVRGGSRPVRTAYLLDRLWPGESVFEETLRVHIHRLRHKIETADGARRYIVTERGYGYAFVASPREAN